MKDFVGRELKDGDVVWVANSPKFAELGVIVDNSLRTPSHIRIRKSSGCIYLLENPTAEELKKKQEILDEYNKYLEEKKGKKSTKKSTKERIWKINWRCLFYIKWSTVYLFWQFDHAYF